MPALPRLLPLTVALAALLLVACAPAAEDETATSSAAAIYPAAPAAVPAAGTLVIYSERRYPFLEPIFNAYTAKTGIAIETRIDGADALIERLAAEGATTPADLFITVDAGNLWQAAERGVLKPLQSPVLEANVPANLRDAQGRWFGLSERVRTILYATYRVDAARLSTYEALAGPEWKGKLCLRSSAKVYNQSMVATMIERLGIERSREVLQGWVANLAAPPFADDTLLIRAIAAGQCEVGIANTYYLGRLQSEDPTFPVRPFWANQQTSGAHVNISGAGVVAHSDRPADAQALLEWLSGAEVQPQFAALNFEYPVLAGIELDPIVAAWGEFKADPVDIAVAGRRQAEAVMLMNEAGWR